MQDLYFSIDSALLRELGEKLVETVHIALIELVKNSYDADATEVDIIFSSDDEGGTTIKIVDNGTGMNFEAVENYWMRIATTNKAERNVSAVFGRPLTGAKGIGRFSCRRLGAHLKLTTWGTKSGKSVGKQRNVEKTDVEFPWLDFEPGTDVTSIKCKGEQTEINDIPTGTILYISDISDEWGPRGLSWLKRQLAVLAANRGVKREGFREDPGFNVKLQAHDFEGGIRDIRDDLMNAGWGTLKAYINKKHQAVCELNALGIGRKTITSSTSFKALNDVSLEIAIMVDDRSQIRDTSILNLGTLQRILPEWGGVQVRYRNFRVYPYGDDDWLDIDHDRGLRRGNPGEELFNFASGLRGVEPGRALLNLLSMRSYVGNVEIGEEAEGFEMKLNREGFILSPAVEQLQAFVRFSIDWSTILRDFYIRQESNRESFIAKANLEKLIDRKIEPSLLIDTAVDFLENRVKRLTETLEPEERQEVEKSVFKATEAIRKQSNSTSSELSRLRLIASTSTLVLIFSHEVKSLLGLLEQSKNSLENIVESLNNSQKKSVHGIINSFVDLKDRLDELLELTSLVGTNQKKAKPGQVSLKEKILRVKKVFSLITQKYEIEINDDNVPNNIIIGDILEAEVYSLLLNVISNSIKSVIAGGKRRLINISAYRANGENVISIKDTGMGLDSERYEEVFIPFIADPDGKLYENLEKRLDSEDKIIVGTGSGLGLGIVKEIVSAHEGSVRFKEPGKNWNSELEIKLP